MQHVKLGSAYVWDCLECGKQHFGIPKHVASLPDEDFERIVDDGNEFVQADFLAEDGDMHDLDDADLPQLNSNEKWAGTPILINRVSILPRFVTCGECGSKFAAMAEITEDEGDDAEPE